MDSMGCGEYHVGVQCVLTNCQSVTEVLGKKNLKDSPCPYLLRFDILKLSFGFKILNLHLLLLITVFITEYLKVGYPLNILQNVDYISVESKAYFSPLPLNDYMHIQYKGDY